MSGNKVRSLVGFSRKKSCVKDVAPKGWFSSRRVAELAGITVRSARFILHKRGVSSVYVKTTAAPCLYWEASGVRRYLKQLPEVGESLPVGWCEAAEACVILGCSRSNVSELERRGVLRGRMIRVATASGVRKVTIFARSAVRGLAALRQAGVRARKRARLQRLKRQWEAVKGKPVHLQME